MESLDYLKFFAALVFVVALMGGLSLILRRLYGYTNQAVLPHKRQIKIIEMLQVDPRRRLVLIQSVNKQHLILLGASSETVIETYPAPSENEENTDYLNQNKEDNA